MTGTKSWQAQIDITETDSEVTAEARLSGANGAPLVGSGTALCNPADENVPAIGDELAVARALSHLSHQLLNAAADDIEAHTHKPVERLRPDAAAPLRPVGDRAPQPPSSAKSDPTVTVTTPGAASADSVALVPGRRAARTSAWVLSAGVGDEGLLGAAAVVGGDDGEAEFAQRVRGDGGLAVAAGAVEDAQAYGAGGHRGLGGLFELLLGGLADLAVVGEIAEQAAGLRVLPDHVGLVGGDVGLARVVGDGQEREVVLGDVLDGRREVVERFEALQFLVGGDGLGGRVQEAVEVTGAGELGLRLGGEGLHELLLAADPSEVGAVADAVAGADVAEGLLVLDGLAARFQVQVRLDVVDGLLGADLYAAQGVDHALETLEVDRGEVVDAQPGALLDGLDGAGRGVGDVAAEAADGERLIDLEAVRFGLGAVTAVAGGDLHPGVTGEGHRGRPLTVGRDVQHHQGVRLHGLQALAVLVAHAGAAVGPDDQDVLGAGAEIGGPVAAELAADVDALDVAVQMLVDPEAGAARAQQDDAEDAAGPGQDAAAAGHPHLARLTGTAGRTGVAVRLAGRSRGFAAGRAGCGIGPSSRLPVMHAGGPSGPSGGSAASRGGCGIDGRGRQRC